MAKSKENPKEVVNIITLVEEYISTLNTRCAEYKVPKVYTLEIIEGVTEVTKEDVFRGETPKKCKRLRLTMADTDNGERITLYTLDFVSKNPAELLTLPYKRTLYRQFLFEAVGIFANTTENHVRQKQAKEAIDRASLKQIRQERPLAPNQAFKPTK